MTNLVEIIKSNDLLKLLLLGVAVYFLFNYMKEPLENTEEPQKELAQPEQPVASEGPAAPVLPALDESNIFDKAQVKPDELLPQYDEANEFAKQNPVSNLLKEQNFLVSGYHVGINTVMQSNKIPYHDLRSAPPIPKTEIGPWSQSSYEQPAGSGRKFLEIGSV